MANRVATFALLAAAGIASVAPVGATDAPFEPQLMRLAEVLGSLHYLRNLCGEEGNRWREEMEKLLTAENPDPLRKSRFVASFNRGYRSFDGVYVNCTASATAAIDLYMKEGETLTRDIAVRFGN